MSYRIIVIATLMVSAVIAPETLAQWGGPVKVTVASAELRKLPMTSTLVGTVEPLRRSIIGSEIAGLVEEMPARQGDFVTAGALICKLRDRTESLQLAEARERLKSLQALERKWQFEKQRIADLYDAQDAADKEVYDTEAEFDQARFAVSAQEVVVARLETELAKTEIRAPFSGYVVSRRAEVGQWLTMGGDVVELTDLSSVLVRVDVPEQAIAFVQPGNTASVFVEGAGRRFAGEVCHVLLQADPTARTFPVEIVVKNPWYIEVDGLRLPRGVVRQQRGEFLPDEKADSSTDAALLAGGMFAKATLQTGPASESVAVPKDAIVSRNGVEYVSMVVPGKEEGSLMAIPTSVTTGIDMDDWIAITSGNLAPDTKVVTTGNESIMFPSPVVVVAPARPGAASAVATEPTSSTEEVGS